MKKLITTISLLLTMLMSGVALTAYASTLDDLTFDVSEQLTLPGQPEREFFNGGEGAPAPIVAAIIEIIEFATIIMGSVAVIVIIIGGFMLMAASGDQTKVGDAKDIIKFAVIGLVVAFLSYVIVTSVQSLFITSELAQ